MGKNNEFGQLDRKTVKNFRMYKAGKHWVFAGLAFLGAGASATLLNQQNVHADTTDNNDVNHSLTVSVNDTTSQVSAASATQVTTAQSISTSTTSVATSSANVVLAIAVTSSDVQSSVESGDNHSTSLSQNSIESSSFDSATNAVTTSTNGLVSSVSSTSISSELQTSEVLLADELDLRDGGAVSYTASQANVINSLNSSYGTSFIFSGYWNSDTSAGAAVYLDNNSDAYLDNGYFGSYTASVPMSSVYLASYTNIKFSNVTYSSGSVVETDSRYYVALDVTDSVVNNNNSLQHLDFGSAFNYVGRISNDLNLETLSLGSAYGSGMSSVLGEFGIIDGWFENDIKLKTLDLRNTQFVTASMAHYNSVFDNSTSSSADLQDLYLGSAFSSIYGLDCATATIDGLSDNVRIHVSGNTSFPSALFFVKGANSSIPNNHTIAYDAIKTDNGHIIPFSTLSLAPQSLYAGNYVVPSGADGYLINTQNYLSSTVDSFSNFINNTHTAISSASNAVNSVSNTTVNVSNAINHNITILSSAYNQVTSLMNQYRNDSTIQSLNNDFNSVSVYMNTAQLNASSAVSNVTSYSPLIDSLNSTFFTASNTAISALAIYSSVAHSVVHSAVHPAMSSFFAMNMGHFDWTSSQQAMNSSALSNDDYSYVVSNYGADWVPLSYNQSDLNLVTSYSTIASSAVAVASSDVAAMWSVYSAIQVPASAAASVNTSFNVKAVIGSASAVTASILADQDNSAAAQQSSAASSAASSQSSFDAQNLQSSINSAMNSQSNVDASSASAALSSAIASALSDQNSAAGSVTNSLNQSASNAISSAAASAASSAINSVNNVLSNSYQSAVNSQVNSASSSADTAVKSTLGSLSDSANRVYNSMADSYQAALKAKGNTNDQAYQSLVGSANAVLASAKASANAALASLANGDSNTNQDTLNSVSASADRDYASLSASYQNQLASQKASDAASYDQLKASGDDTLVKLRSNNAQQLASQQASDTASASSAIDLLNHSLQASASDALNRAANSAADDATKSVSDSLASSYAKALADRPGDVNQPLVAHSAAVDQLALLINSAAIAAQQAAQSAATAHGQVDYEQSSVNSLSDQLGSNVSGTAIKSQFNADQATISSADAIASSNAQLASSAANAADQLKHQSFSDLNAANQATSMATSLFNVADQAKFKAQSANTIAQSAAGDAAQQLNHLQSLVDDNLDAQSNAKVARSDADATSQTVQSVKAIDDQFNAAQTSLHDQSNSLTSQYQKVADQAVSAEVNAHVAASLAADNPNNAQLQAANSQAQSLASQVYQQIKTAQGNVKAITSLSVDADAQGQVIDGFNHQIDSANSTAQSAATVASSAALQNDVTTARSARAVADSANQAVQQLNGSLTSAQQQLGSDQAQIKQLMSAAQIQLSTVTQNSDQIQTNLQTIQQLATPNVDSGFSVITDHNDQQPVNHSNDTNPFKLKYYGIENVTDQATIKALKHRTNLNQINAALSQRYVGAMVQFKLNGQLHRQFDFTKQNVIKNIKAGTKFKVQAVEVKNGVARFLVGHRQWITANVNYIDVLNPNK